MIHEVRASTLRPGTVAEFEERFAKRKPLREKYSTLGLLATSAPASSPDRRRVRLPVR